MSGPDFASYMEKDYPHIKSITFDHHEAVTKLDDAVMDIYETVDDNVLAVRLRNKGEASGGVLELVSTTVSLMHLVEFISSLEYSNLILFLLHEIMIKGFEYHNSICIVVPNVVGKHRDAARTLLKQMGFEVVEVERYGATQDKDQVTDQDKGPDNRWARCIQPGNTVKIEVSIGPNPSLYTLHDVWVRASRGRIKTEYEPCETIELTIWGGPSTTAPLTVTYG